MADQKDKQQADWKNSEIWTDSLWIIPERDKSGKHSGFYHGNFVPQIPRQLILRYTKIGDIVFDPFIGSGTTAFEAETLDRKLIGVDIQPTLISNIKSKIDTDSNGIKLIVGDSATDDVYKKAKNLLGEKRVKLSILHPPYFDIIRFSNDKNDLSNAGSQPEFIEQFSRVLDRTISIMDKPSYLAIVIGDKYSAGEWIPLGFYLMAVAQKKGLKLKSIVVKNMEGNRAKNGQQALWKYRSLHGDYYLFKHEYIYIFKKEF
ncbi:MAG: DNA methyltransferase [Patescibacteria group bacterium]|nr:DNA methyltransferase [Patescibacteria group bacterium]